MNCAPNPVNAVIPAKKSTNKLQGKTNLLVVVLMVFVTVAAMQTLQIGSMRSEAKSVGEDIHGIRMEQKLLREQYAFYGNNLSYYFDD